MKIICYDNGDHFVLENHAPYHLRLNTQHKHIQTRQLDGKLIDHGELGIA